MNPEYELERSWTATLILILVIWLLALPGLTRDLFARGCALLWRMCPSRRMFFTATVRVGIGAAILYAAPHVPSSTLRGVVEFMGRMMCFLAALSLINHSEAIFQDSIARVVERVTGIRIN